MAGRPARDEIEHRVVAGLADRQRAAGEQRRKIRTRPLDDDIGRGRLPQAARNSPPRDGPRPARMRQRRCEPNGRQRVGRRDRPTLGTSGRSPAAEPPPEVTTISRPSSVDLGSAQLGMSHRLPPSDSRYRCSFRASSGDTGQDASSGRKAASPWTSTASNSSAIRRSASAIRSGRGVTSTSRIEDSTSAFGLAARAAAIRPRNSSASCRRPNGKCSVMTTSGRSDVASSASIACRVARRAGVDRPAVLVEQVAEIDALDLDRRQLHEGEGLVLAFAATACRRWRASPRTRPRQRPRQMRRPDQMAAAEQMRDRNQNAGRSSRLASRYRGLQRLLRCDPAPQRPRMPVSAAQRRPAPA